MRVPLRRFILCSLAVSLAATFGSCADSPRAPTSPTSVLGPAQTLSWECGRQAQSATADGWWFAPAEGCPAAFAVPDVGVGLISAAPANLRSTASGTTVRLDWDAVPDAVAFLIEAGSASSLADLARLNSGTPAPSLVVNNVPSGTYFVRVRAIGSDGVPGPPSNEITVRVGVGGSCAAAPLPPTGFAAVVDGSRVSLTWIAPAGGDSVSSYIVEAGSAPNLRNLVVFDTGVPATRLDAQAPTGLYYTRIRGRNACGIGAGSNEFIIAVGVPLPQLPPPTPPEGGGTPPPPSGGGPGGGSGGGSDGGTGGGPTCTYSVSPSEFRLAPAGGDFDVRISTTAGCAWSASSSSGFVNLLSGAQSSGTGVARFLASANGGGARQGNVRISFASGGGQDVAVTQAASPPATPVSEPIETRLQVPSQPNTSVQLINTAPPEAEPNTTGNAGGCANCRPVAAPPVVSIAGASTVALQLNSANGVPFDSVIVAASALGSPAGTSYLLIDINPATTSASLLVNLPPGPTVSASVALMADSQVPANYVTASLTPPPSGPAVQDGVQIPAQSQVISQQLIAGSPPTPRPNAGGCACPVLGPPTVSLGNVALTASRQASRVTAQAVTNTLTVRLSTTNQVPFNSVIVTTGTLVGDTPQASSYYLLQLAAPTTSAAIVLNLSGTFLGQFAVTMNSDAPSNYVSASLAPPSTGSIYSGALSATPAVTFGGASCQYTQKFTNVAVSVVIDGATVTQSEVTATGVESVLAGCSAQAIPANQHRYVLQASSILLNGTSIKVTYSQTAGQPAVSLTFEGTISGNVINGTLIFRRTDNASLPWTLTAPVSLTR